LRWIETTSAARGVALHALGAGLGGRGGAEVLAPGDRAHAEGLGHGHHLRPDAAQAHQPEGLAVQARADGLLPAPLAHVRGFGRQVAQGGQDQGPGQLHGGNAAAAGAADQDAQLAGRLQVDGGVAHARRGQQPQARQPRQHLAGERRALAQGHHHGEGLQGLGHRVRVAQHAREALHAHALGQALPIGVVQRDVLVVVQQGDADHGRSLALQWETGPRRPSRAG
jgi:hypothetical protein